VTELVGGTPSSVTPFRHTERMAENLLGYARVSTLDQDAALQVQALEAAGCTKVFIDHASGSTTKRPELDKLMEYAREGDVLCV